MLSIWPEGVVSPGKGLASIYGVLMLGISSWCITGLPVCGGSPHKVVL